MTEATTTNVAAEIRPGAEPDFCPKCGNPVLKVEFGPPATTGGGTQARYECPHCLWFGYAVRTQEATR